MFLEKYVCEIRFIICVAPVKSSLRLKYSMKRREILYPGLTQIMDGCDVSVGKGNDMVPFNL